MALDMEVGFGPGHIVLDGDPAPLPQKGGRAPPNFRPISIVPKRLYVSGYPRKGHSTPPFFSTHVYCGHGRASLEKNAVFFAEYSPHLFVHIMQQYVIYRLQ